MYSFFNSGLLESLQYRVNGQHIGPFPPSFLEACQRRADFFDEQGEITHPGLSATKS
jgi:hypothetical protein